MNTFRSRLLLFIVFALLFISVAPLILVGLVGLRTFDTQGQRAIDLNARILDDRSLDTMRAQAADTATRLALFLRQRDADLRVLASIPPDEAAYLNFARAKHGEIWTLDPNNNEQRFELALYRELAFISPEGREIIRIENICTDYPHDCVIQRVAERADVNSRRRFLQEDYFAQAQSLAPGEIYVGRPVGYYVPFSRSFKGAQNPAGERFAGVIHFIMPVYDEGEKQGYVMLALDHTHILEFIHHLSPTAPRPLPAIDPRTNNFAYLIGSDGLAIAHVEHSNIGGADPAGDPVPPFTISESGPGNFYTMGFLSPVFPQVMQDAITQSTGVVPRFELRDMQSLSRSLTYHVIPYYTGRNYASELGFGLAIVSTDYNARTVGTDVLTRQLQRDLNALTGRLGLFIVVTLGAVAVVAVFFARGVVAPIRAVTRYSQIMEQRGLTDEEIAALKKRQGQGEVDQLAHTFGKMAETVRAREGEIATLLNQTDEALRRRVQELSALEEVGQQLTATLDLEGVYQSATQALADHTSAEGVQLLIYPDSTEGAPTIVKAGREMSKLETEQSFVVPLKVEEQIIGQFLLYARNQTFDENERSFARQLAGWVSVAANNARLFDHIQEQQRQVIEANRLKSEFLAVISHELRTPLNAIIGFLGIMLMSGELSERNSHLAQRARANSERLLNLITDILDISRIEAGRLQLYPVHVPLRDLIEKLSDQMSVLAEEKNITFSVHVEADVPETIYADEDALTKIITNLLSNGFKFTEQGGVGLYVAYAAEQVTIRVKDTGIGIPAHMQAVIFDSFRQVDGSITRKYGGSGLGLSIVYHICNAMGGTIRVESMVDRGSEFIVTLPAGRD